MIGKTISHYKILDKLGQGGMGEVFLAEDAKLHRKVALKFLPSTTASDPEARERLLREARAASKLHHPNIVTIHAIEEQDGKDFIVMEHVEGVPITQYVSEHKPSSTDLNATLRQLCDGLHHAHTSGVVHRDLKPDNILVEANGRVRIMDFGVAILSGTPRLTQTGSMVGTTAYVSPEQVRGQDADERSDLFSLGVLMYQLCTGKHPFTGAHEAATLYSIAHEQPPVVTELVPDISSDVAGVIQKCLSKEPADRFASAHEISQVLTGTSTTSVTSVPETKYAKSGSTNIAYQVFGSGNIDLVWVMGWVSHVELIWQHPYSRDFLQRLGKHFRVMIFDKRGTGLSDRVAELPPIEQRMDDVRAVMDAAHSERAVLMGISEGGPMCALFAATYPDRTLGLMIYGSYPVRIRDKDFPWAPSWEEREAEIADVEEGWGGAGCIPDLAPSQSHNLEYMKWMTTYFRQSASPGDAAALLRMNSLVDIRSILPTIRVQTLVLHRTGDRDVQVECGRYLAANIPKAHMVELDGEDHIPWVGNTDQIHKAVSEFVKSLDVASQVDTILLTALRINVEASDPDNWVRLLKSACNTHPPRQLRYDQSGATVLFEGPIRSLKVAQELSEQLSQAGIRWSIGLHSGECALSGETASGVAVQVADHLADLEAGEAVRLTSTVRELVAEAGLEFVAAGDVTVPGIDYMWHVVKLPTPHRQAAPKGSPSIAVLPFTNMSADPENEYFSDGLTEELLNALAKNPELKVTGRTSSFAFKGKLEDLRGIGQKLGVETLLEGSVRKAGNRVRITVQLVKASDGFHLWTETYDRVLDDIFAVQDDIAAAVSSALDVTLLGGSTTSKQVNAEAYNLVLQAKHYATRNSKEALFEAEKLFRKALDLDPNSARACAGLARTYGQLTGQGFLDHEKGSAKAREAALKALALDDNDPQVHDALGWSRFMGDFNWIKSRKHFDKALKLAPGDGSILTGLSVLEVCLGNNERALELSLKAIELDPLNAFAHRELARPYVAVENWDKAEICYKKALELSPDIVLAHSLLGLVYMYQGDVHKGIEEAKKEKAAGYRLYALAALHHVAGDADESDRALEELKEGGEGGESGAFQIAFVHAVRHELDEAFHWLNRSYELRDTGTVFIKTHPGFKPIRADPRYAEFLDQLGLPK